jgi:hypothetical protein
MAYRARIYYTDAQKAGMLDHWQHGKTLHSIARLFARGHSSLRKIVVSISGSVSALQAGRKVARLAPGELIGAGIALTNQISAFEADFIEVSRYMS